MPSHAPLYLGFDLSTQQLKAIAVTTDVSVVCEARFEFDVDSTYHEVEKGVITNGKEQEV
jgi:xylulokinase